MENCLISLKCNRDKILDLDSRAMTHIIKRSCEIKADVVSKDERESGLRAILNYGHTIGHAVETVSGYKRFLHGEAVAIGMFLEAKLSQMLGLIDKDQVSRIKALIDSYGLPSEIPADMDVQSILLSMQLDKKTVAGEMKFIFPEKIGQVRIHKGVTENTIRDLLQSKPI